MWLKSSFTTEKCSVRGMLTRLRLLSSPSYLVYLKFAFIRQFNEDIESLYLTGQSCHLNGHVLFLVFDYKSEVPASGPVQSCTSDQISARRCVTAKTNKLRTIVRLIEWATDQVKLLLTKRLSEVLEIWMYVTTSWFWHQAITRPLHGYLLVNSTALRMMHSY